MMRLYFPAMIVAAMVCAANHASAVVAIPSTCTDFTAANGTSTFPGTSVGTVGTGAGQVCQIGNIAANNVSGTGTFVNNDHPTSIYSFYWGGGALTIQEKLGNNGLGLAVDVSFDALATSTSTMPTSTIASIAIPFQSGPTSFYTVFSTSSLGAGYYAIENQLQANADDPTFQVNFSTPTATPEPASLALVLGGLAGMTFIRRRQNARA